MQRQRREIKATTRAAAAFGLACAITLFGMIAVVFLFDREDVGTWGFVLLANAPIVLAGLAAGLVGGGLLQSFPIASRWHWFVIAVPVAAFTLAVSVGYVTLLGGGSGRAGAGSESPLAIWILVVLFAPLFEEWLCRGVAWNAASTMASPRAALVLTAVLFAFLHGLQGHMLALPHRFVGGLALGWLRLRSGSVLPGILCHALHNAVAISWLGDGD